MQCKNAGANAARAKETAAETPRTPRLRMETEARGDMGRESRCRDSLSESGWGTIRPFRRTGCGGSPSTHEER